MELENAISARIEGTPSQLAVTDQGDVTVRLPSQPSWMSVACFWQGSDPRRARTYSQILAHAPGDIRYLQAELSNTRRELEASQTHERELMVEIERLRDQASRNELDSEFERSRQWDRGDNDSRV